MNRIRMRRNYRLSSLIILVIILITLFTTFFFIWYNTSVNPKIVDVAEAKINKFMESFLSMNIGYEILDEDILEDILIINKNDKGEILYVDYNLEKAYLVLDTVSTKLETLVSDLEKGKFSDISDNNIKTSEYGLVLELPMFIASDYALMSNLGPKIYMKVNFVGSILTNIKSKITEYGINNALVELYVTIKLSQELISPVTDNELSIEYDCLIASQVINGTVPNIYGGSILESREISIPLE